MTHFLYILITIVDLGSISLDLGWICGEEMDRGTRGLARIARSMWVTARWLFGWPTVKEKGPEEGSLEGS